MLFLDESIMHVISLVLSLYCSGGRKVVQPQKKSVFSHPEVAQKQSVVSFGDHTKLAVLSRN